MIKKWKAFTIQYYFISLHCISAYAVRINKKWPNSINTLNWICFLRKKWNSIRTPTAIKNMIHHPAKRTTLRPYSTGFPSQTSEVDSISRRKTRNILPKRTWQPSVNMRKISLPNDLHLPWFQTMENKHPWEVIPYLSLNMQQVAVAEAVSQNGIIYQQEEHWRRTNSNMP